MNFLTTYETPLRSYIQARIALLENALEEEVRNRDNVDIALLEQQFDRESDSFIAGVTRRIHQIRDEIKSHRPTNIQDQNYETRMIQYRQFIQSSSISMNRMTDWINSVFEQVTGIVKSIFQWMIDNARTIVDMNLSSQIQGQSSMTSSVAQVIQRKYQNLKTLVLKLKPSRDSLQPDELDEFVDEIIIDLHQTLLSHVNHLREQIKQIRPKLSDPFYEKKMFIYKQLLEEMISIFQIFEQCINRILDEFHILIEQIWNEISMNNSIHLDHFIEQHQHRTQAFIQQQWINYFNQFESKLKNLS